MDHVTYDWRKECQKVIEEVDKEYKYGETKLGKALLYVLKKLVPEMLEDANYEERQLFFSMLRTTPIVVIPEGGNITIREIAAKYLGDCNKHVDVLDSDPDSYNTLECDAAFCSCPILDEKANVIGVKKFIYVKAISDIDKFFDGSELTDPKDIFSKRNLILFKTVIKLRDLAHELGHAWVSEYEPYRRDGNIIIRRIGCAQTFFQIDKVEDGRYSLKPISKTGGLTEEALNTDMQLTATERYLGISRENLQEVYNSGYLDLSMYQGELSNLGEMLFNSKLKKYVNACRFKGDKSAIDNLNELMGKSPIYINREADRDEEQEVKRIFKSPEENGLTEFCNLNRKDFFPDKKSMTPLQLFNNAMDQCFAVSSYRGSGKTISDDMYKKLISPSIKTAETLIKDAIRALEQERDNEKDDKNITE